MKILYFSDIHLEVWQNITRLTPAGDWSARADVPYPLSLGPDLSKFVDEKIDVCVLAGDIGRFVDGSASPVKYADQLSHYLNCEVMFVPGNHEYYGCQDIFGLIKSNRSGFYVNRVRLLDRDVAVIDDVVFIGATLWTDYRLMGWEYEADCMKTAGVYMADHCGAIRKVGAAGGKKNFSTADARQMHKDDARFIGDMLDIHRGQKIVVVTHHVPLCSNETKNPRYPVDATTSGFMSHLPGLVEKAGDSGCKAWIFGHHHYSLQSEAYDVKLLSAQMGYPNERIDVTSWNGPQVLEV